MEFAIVAPILITLLAGIIQFSAVYFLQNNMLNVARDTARRVSIGDLSQTAAATAAQNELVNWGGTFQVQVVDPVATSDPNDSDVVVTISLPFADATPVDYLDSLTSGNLSVSVTMRSDLI